MKSRTFSQRKKLEARIEAVRKNFSSWSVDACFIDDPTDLFYLTGMELSLGHLIISRKDASLFVDGRYFQAAQTQSPVGVAELKDEEKMNFLTTCNVKKLLFDSRTSYQRYLALAALKKKLNKKHKSISLLPQAAPLKEIRLIKDQQEVDSLKKSARLLWKGFQYLKKNLKSGITEKEAALIFELFCLRNGAEKLAFEPIIAFGENSSMPHYRAGNRKLKTKDLILIDIGVVVDHYHSDMTQVLFKGKADPFLKNIFHVVKNSQEAALSLCRPGVKVGDLDRAARDVMAKEGLQQYFLHSLGHGIGLETHEFPRIKFKGEDHDYLLKKGMVFTIEPGLYVPERGGIRLETTVVITDTGYENLFPSLTEVNL